MLQVVGQLYRPSDAALAVRGVHPSLLPPSAFPEEVTSQLPGAMAYVAAELLHPWRHVRGAMGAWGQGALPTTVVR